MAIILLQQRLNQAKLLTREHLHASAACVLAALAADAARCAATHRTLHLLALERDLTTPDPRHFRLDLPPAEAPAEPAPTAKPAPQPAPAPAATNRKSTIENRQS